MIDPEKLVGTGDDSSNIDDDSAADASSLPPQSPHPAQGPSSIDSPPVTVAKSIDSDPQATLALQYDADVGDLDSDADIAGTKKLGKYRRFCPRLCVDR